MSKLSVDQLVTAIAMLEEAGFLVVAPPESCHPTPQMCLEAFANVLDPKQVAEDTVGLVDEVRLNVALNDALTQLRWQGEVTFRPDGQPDPLDPLSPAFDPDSWVCC
jgi:hypothetical protein